jgi:hypothetical protein
MGVFPRNIKSNKNRFSVTWCPQTTKYTGAIVGAVWCRSKLFRKVIFVYVLPNTSTTEISLSGLQNASERRSVVVSASSSNCLPVFEGVQCYELGWYVGPIPLNVYNLTHITSWEYQYVLPNRINLNYTNWFFMTPSIATKFQYVNSLLFSFLTHYVFRPLRAILRWDIQLDIWRTIF